MCTMGGSRYFLLTGRSQRDIINEDYAVGACGISG
jgi:hypothetical protein